MSYEAMLCKIAPLMKTKNVTSVVKLLAGGILPFKDEFFKILE